MILSPELCESVWDMPDSSRLLCHTDVFTQVSRLIMSPVWLDGTPGFGLRLQLENVCFEPYASVLTPSGGKKKLQGEWEKKQKGDAYNLWWGPDGGGVSEFELT